MNIVIDEKHSLIKDRFFPISVAKMSSKKHSVLVGVGGNEGGVIRRFKKLFLYLLKDSRVDIIKTSPIFKNPPFGFLEQDDFYNCVVFLKTNLCANDMLKFALHTESVFKRKRSFVNAPRTLDLDIIFYDNIKIDSKKLTIPHKEYKNRASVLIPLFLI